MRLDEPRPDGDQLRDIQSITDAALSALDPQALLDVLVDRVREILRADTAAVLLLDPPSRQLVATAASGLEEEVKQGVRIPIGKGFAGRIAALGQLVILDQVDHTKVVNPILLARGIRSLMGAPLRVGGRVIGVLHVGTLGDRVFTRDDGDLLQLAADRAALAVQAINAQADRAAAAALQRSLLPAALPAVPGLEMAARYVPGSGHLGGDWYDVFTLPSGNVCAVIGDVVGSGLPAAVIMGRIRSALRSYALESDDPSDVLERLNRKITHFEPGAMATVLCAMFSPTLDRVRMSCAGHLPPLIARPGRPTPSRPRSPRTCSSAWPAQAAPGHRPGSAARNGGLPVHRRAGRAARPADRRGHQPAGRRALRRRARAGLRAGHGGDDGLHSAPRRRRAAHPPRPAAGRFPPDRGHGSGMNQGRPPVAWSGRHVVVTLPTEIDTVNSADVFGLLSEAAGQDAEVITGDLSGTAFCDSAGVQALARAYEQAAASGTELRLAVGDSPVARILQLAGLDQVIPVYRHVQQSLDTAPAGPARRRGDRAPAPRAARPPAGTSWWRCSTRCCPRCCRCCPRPGSPRAT